MGRFTLAADVAAKTAEAKGKKTDRPKKKNRRHKPAGRPKRALCAYNLFFRHERAILLNGSSSSGSPRSPSEQSRVSSNTMNDSQPTSSTKNSPEGSRNNSEVSKNGKRKHRKSHGVIGFQDLAKHIGAKWKTLDVKTRLHFEAQAAKDKERYKRELAAYHKRELEAYQAKVQKAKQKVQGTSDDQTGTMLVQTTEDAPTTTSTSAGELHPTEESTPKSVDQHKGSTLELCASPVDLYLENQSFKEDFFEQVHLTFEDNKSAESLAEESTPKIIPKSVNQSEESPTGFCPSPAVDRRPALYTISDGEDKSLSFDEHMFEREREHFATEDERAEATRENLMPQIAPNCFEQSQGSTLKQPVLALPGDRESPFPEKDSFEHEHFAFKKDLAKNIPQKEELVTPKSVDKYQDSTPELCASPVDRSATVFSFFDQRGKSQLFDMDLSDDDEQQQQLEDTSDRRRIMSNLMLPTFDDDDTTTTMLQRPVVLQRRHSFSPETVTAETNWDVSVPLPYDSCLETALRSVVEDEDVIDFLAKKLT